MSLFRKKIPAKRIALLREAVNLRKKLEKKVEETEKEKYIDKIISINKSIAKRDLPMIDYLGKLKDNRYMQVYGKEFIDHLRKYINLLKQEEYQKAIELNQVDFLR